MQTLTRPGNISIPSKYLEKRGARETAFDPPDAGSLRCFFTGEVGHGKTSLGLSIPKAAYLDIEHKTDGIPHTAPGTVIFGNGSPPWSLKDYEELIEELLADAAAGKRYFDTVVFDTLGGLCQLVKDTFTNAWAPKFDPDKPWVDFSSYGADGAGYGKMNSWILSRIARLENAGYGWTVFAHKTIKVVDSGDGGNTREVKTDGNPGVVTGLSRGCDYAGTIALERRASIEERTRTVKGREVTTKDTVEKWEYILDLETMPEKTGVRAMIRQHVPMVEPEITIPDGQGWPRFIEVYQKSVDARRPKETK